MKQNITILGIESSCDETAVAVYNSHKGIVSHKIHSQIGLHRFHGGVVPELAARDHVKHLSSLLRSVFATIPQKIEDIDAIAYTRGPGLIGSLMAGSVVSHSLSYAMSLPIVGIHHLEAHIMAVMLEKIKPTYPFISLIVSGGHTMIVHVKNFGEYEVIGETLDDAAGEAFDKTARLIGIPYPGGAELSKIAARGTENKVLFPRPMIKKKCFNFSFSGLKTFSSRIFKKKEKNLLEASIEDICKGFEDSIVEILINKSIRAMKSLKIKQLVVTGGVSSNKQLREKLTYFLGNSVFFPRIALCTDNAAMVAYAGYKRVIRGEYLNWKALPKAQWPIAFA